MRELLIKLLVLAAVSVSVAGLLRVGAWAIQRATPYREGEYRLPTYYGATGLLCGAIAGLCLGLGLLGGMSPARHDFLPWIGLVVFFAGGGVYAVVTAANWRLWLDPNGLQVRDGWGRTRPYANWGDVQRVRSGRSSMCFDIREGGRLEVPLGAPGLLDALQAAHAAGAAMDDAVIQQMRRAARGEHF